MSRDDYKNATLLGKLAQNSIMTLKIAISGKMCSGKTTLLDLIQEYHDVEVCSGGADQDILQVAQRFSLADPVKEVAHRYFGMPEEYKDRPLLQQIGQQFRNIDPMVWVKLLIQRANEYADIQDELAETDGDSMIGCAICDDVRFPNEVNGLKEEGWITIRLEVDEEERLNRVKEVYGSDWENHWNNRFEISETALDDYSYEWDYTFTNASVEELIQAIPQIYERIRLVNSPQA